MQKDDPWVGTWRPHRPRGLIAAQIGCPGPKYALPGLTGAFQHDPTKPKAPAFSFGARHKVAKTDCSPGPKYLLQSTVTRYGQVGTPAFSLHGRLELPASFRTPGPAQYFPEHSKKFIFRATPAYSLSGRHKEMTKNQIPGPAAYMLPPILGTKGVTTLSAPSSTLIGRTQKGSFFEDLKKTPGPAAYNAVDPYFSRPKPPQCTLKGRNFPPNKTTQTPGPGSYFPERTTFTKPEASGFSFGLRHSQYTVPLMVKLDEY
ncbi:Outer dense fiber protein 3 [Characodon lateralis]|uniref:Outer dense fiber protein 3 n=1 Tax=Characodon lateralis TaxID=208331 RepID=A0ABU7ENE2_9TELE|nr:Outer dense fiber protein 3 [Characodon lateralis]